MCVICTCISEEDFINVEQKWFYFQFFRNCLYWSTCWHHHDLPLSILCGTFYIFLTGSCNICTARWLLWLTGVDSVHSIRCFFGFFFSILVSRIFHIFCDNDYSLFYRTSSRQLVLLWIVDFISEFSTNDIQLIYKSTKIHVYFFSTFFY